MGSCVSILVLEKKISKVLSEPFKFSFSDLKYGTLSWDNVFIFQECSVDFAAFSSHIHCRVDSPEIG